MSNRADYHLPPTEGFVVTHFLTVADVNRSAEFYVRIFGGTLARRGFCCANQCRNCPYIN